MSDKEYIKKWRKQVVLAAHGGESFGWISLGTQQGVDLFYSKQENGQIWCKGVGEVFASMEKVDTYLKDYELRLRSGEFVKGALVETIDECTAVYYSVVNFPNPFFNRDIVYLQHTAVWPDNIGVSLIRSVERESSPPTQRFVRAFVDCGGYVYEPLYDESNKVRLTFVLQLDPQGIVPAWAARIVAQDLGLNVARVKEHFDPSSDTPKLADLSPQQKFLARHDDIQTMEVKPKSALVIRIPVSSARSIVSWEFLTEKNDIGFGVTFEPAEEGVGSIVVREPKRIDSHLAITQDHEMAHVPGTLVLTFDNNYSTLSSKTLLVRYMVTPASDDFIKHSKSLEDLHKATEANKQIATRAEEQERHRRMSEIEKTHTQEELQRRQNQKMADKLMDNEQKRRITEETMAHAQEEAMRKVNQSIADRAVEAEKESRITQEHVAVVQQEVVRRRSISEAVRAEDEEQRRRIAEAAKLEVVAEVARVKNAKSADHDEDEEKERRVKEGDTPDKRERRKSITEALEAHKRRCQAEGKTLAEA